MVKDYKYYINKITSFNTDKDVITLRELYERPSFLEIISKQRSETTVSAFLKWMFSIKGDENGFLSPIMLLLDILVKKLKTETIKMEGNDTYYEENLYNLILTRKLKVSNKKIETEYYLNDLAKKIKREIEIHKENPKLEESIKSKDRIDILIESEISGLENKKINRLQIIIENKIDSEEGKNQTNRYFNGAYRNDYLQFFVYLKPDYNEKKAKDEHFINISYQDILDGIIIPLLKSSSISERDRFLLEDFKNELMFPNINIGKEQSRIAVSQEISENIMRNIWAHHKEFIIDLLLTKQDLNNIKGIYNKEEVIKYINKKDEKFNDAESITYIDKNSNEFRLLEEFMDENWNFINALLDILPKKEYDNISALIENSSNPRNKNSLFFNGIEIGSNLSNYDTIIKIIQKWCDLNFDKYTNNINEIIEKLNKVFPKEKINPYYKNGKLLKQLFYEYKEDFSYTFDGKSEAWYKKKADFEFPKDKYLEINGNKIVLAKMWRKDAIEKFINYLKDDSKFEDFENKLEIVLS